MITADNITDEQIRELRGWSRLVTGLTMHAFANPDAYEDPVMRRLAEEERKYGRARCATIINARDGAKP